MMHKKGIRKMHSEGVYSQEIATKIQKTLGNKNKQTSNSRVWF